MDTIQSVMGALRELEEDSFTPKHMKVKIGSAIKILSEDAEHSIKISKALNALEVLAEDTNVQAETRMQIFNIVSLLEVA